MLKILHIDSSARHDGSVSRELGTRLIERLGPDTDVKVRDLAAGVPLLSESTLDAMWTPEAERTPDQQAQLSVADAFIAELMDADVIVIGLPIYNFGPPAAMKAWADLVARAILALSSSLIRRIDSRGEFEIHSISNPESYLCFFIVICHCASS